MKGHHRRGKVTSSKIILCGMELVAQLHCAVTSTAHRISTDNFPRRTRDDIELRTCNKQGPGGSYPYAGEIYIQLAEIYIK